MVHCYVSMKPTCSLDWFLLSVPFIIVSRILVNILHTWDSRLIGPYVCFCLFVLFVCLFACFFLYEYYHPFVLSMILPSFLHTDMLIFNFRL